MTYPTSLHLGVYGFFRAQSTNGTYRSTNAFGAILGDLAEGYSYVGNPFAATIHTNFFPAPVTGLSAFKWNPTSSNLTASDYIFGSWTTNLTITECEGVAVYNPSTN